MPLTNSSVTSRFAVSALTNILRGGLAFITTLIIARELGPKEYGDYAFLFGTFMATTSLLDFGTSHAFQTFISQKERGKMFVLSYACWQLLQFILALLVIGVFFPENWLEQVWLGHKKDLILLTLAAVFMQQQAWATMIKIGESKRLTHIVQLLNLSIAVVHFFLIVGFWIGEFISVRLILWLILVEHLIILLVACKALSVSKIEDEVFEGRLVLQEYIAYCSPLIFFSIIGFGYVFADRWLLQNYGGSIQQGLYEIGLRFGMVSLIITMSLHNIFWKEIAEAKEKGDFERMRALYHKASRFLFSLSIFLAGFLVPYSKEIIRLTLGPSYMEGSLVLVVMLIYAAFRSLSILNSSMLLASSKPKAHVAFGIIFMTASIPTSYLVLAPIDAQLPGLQLGSSGLALKTLVIAVFQSSVVSWWICRDHGWKFDWIYQIIVLSAALSLGWLSFKIIETLKILTPLNFFIEGGLALFVYCGLVGIMVWSMPGVAGVSRQELKDSFLKLVNLSRV